MRKFILFMLCLCVHWIARGQTGYDYRYWFDNDVNSASSGTSAGSTWHFSVPLDGLEESLHVFHFQVCDTAGVWSAPVSRYFVKLTQPIEEQGTYWFDDDYSTHITTPVTNGIMEVDVSALADGFHAFHFMAGAHTLSAVRTSFFIKQTDPSQFHYLIWAADDPENILKGKYTGEPVSVDVSSLKDGFHTLYVQVVGGASATHPSSAMFIKIPQTVGVDFMNCLFMVDDKFYRSEQVPASGGVIEWTLDVDHLDQGLHRYLVQVVTPSGAGSTIKEGFFLRETMKSELRSLQCCFMVDGDSATVQSGTLSGGIYHFDLDVTKVTDGLHRIAYWLVGDNAVSTAVNSAFFMKTPLGGNGIAQYHYWINNNEEKRHEVQLAKRVNPLSLITLLPVETQPLRSSNFQFAIKNNEPLIYARNELHLRFFDVAGRFSEITKEYVDEQVKGSVTPVGELQATQKFEKVADNDIRWYTMQAAPGDTVAFKLSQAATVQVFAPSGKEVFHTSESASVKWNGIHTWEDGTYYLAVHNVTGSKPTMTLDYMHMDKYDVVDWDVHTVGNGGCSTITFKGNGFRDLYAVDLYTAEGDTIHSLDVSHESDAETAVTFDFSGVELGEYNAVFHFTTEDLNVGNIITVEEAVDIDLATVVSFPRIFSRSATYTVKITNKGNMTAYAVPIYTWIKSLTKDGIYKITYDGLGLDSFMDGINTDSLSAYDVSSLQAISEQLSDDHYFMHFWVKDENNPNDSIYVRSNYYYTNIAPHETKTLHLTIYTREVDTYAYFTVPEEWHSYSIEHESPVFQAKAHFAKSSAGEWYCCYRERIECVADIIVNGLDIASLFSVPGPTATNIADCVAGIVNQTLKAAGDTYCGKNDVQGDFMKKVNNVVKGMSIAAVVSSCASMFGVKNASEISVAIDNLLHPSTAVSCIQAFFTPIPGCPPIPPGGGGSNGGKSHDPNDIYGYLSEAGSKLMTDSVECVNYTIEFENDTTFATLPAHTIVIKDTLDSHYFDLKAFIPTAIRIGSQNVLLEDKDITTQNNVTSFIKTIDMRPSIYAIAQAEGTFNQKTGIAEWRFTTLDPMTMEPAEDVMQGILPVNYDGMSGIGEVMFEIGMKQGKVDGTEIPNRASITFDANDPILTPTWTNTVDAIAPTSTILGAIQAKTDSLTLRIAGEDNRSGVWKYDVYAQMGQGSSWEKVAENVPAVVAEGETETLVDVRIYEGIEYGFLVLATDSAGNVERKEFEAEFELSTVKLGDANGDGVVDALDVVLAISYYLGEDVYLNFAAADVVADGEINALDVVAMQDIYLNTSHQALAPRKRKVKSQQLEQRLQ